MADHQAIKPIRVLVVDDSSILRQVLRKIIESEPDMKVVGTACDPYVARELVVKERPHVITLDIEMPRMDGITFLEKLMKHHPIPTIILSSLSSRHTQSGMQALSLGAVDVIEKPKLDISQGLMSGKDKIITAIRNAFAISPDKLRMNLSRPAPIAVQNKGQALLASTHQILAIGSSTGGTEALKRILPMFPPNIPGTVIVQHMPPGFTKSFADNLNSICPFEVLEAKEGDRVIPGRVLIAPGNYHMVLKRSGAYYYVSLHQGDTIHGVRPAVDILFDSVAQVAGANAVGTILTGMGKDGAAGLLKMKEVGAFTMAQDEESSIVFGMPKEAIERGATQKVVPLDQIPGLILRNLKKYD